MAPFPHPSFRAPMIVRIPDCDLCHRRQSNLPLLIAALARFKPAIITGYCVLEETDFLKYFRLKFFGTDEFDDTVLTGPAFAPEVLEIPQLASQMEELVGEFIRQIRALEPDDVPEPVRIKVGFEQILDSATRL